MDNYGTVGGGSTASGQCSVAALRCSKGGADYGGTGCRKNWRIGEQGSQVPSIRKGQQQNAMMV